MNEIWKIIEDYPDYEINNLGIIRRIKDNYILNQNIKDSKYSPYLRVTLIKDLIDKKIKRNEVVHRLVAKTFIPNPDNKPYVNHKDENKLNNNVDNLEWCTKLHNNCYGTRLNKISDKKSQPVVCEFRNKKAIYKSRIIACLCTGVSASMISCYILNRKSPKNGAYWRNANSEEILRLGNNSYIGDDIKLSYKKLVVNSAKYMKYNL